MRTIIHIGHYKCGTTALQRRLFSTRDALADQGVVYPDLNALGGGKIDLPNHSALVFELLRGEGLQVPLWYEQKRAERSDVAADLDTLLQRLGDVLDKARANGQDVVLSSEEFMRFGDPQVPGLAPALIEAIGDDTEITIFAHLRRPDGQLPSWYNQMVKLGAKPRNLSENIAGSVRTIQVDYAKALSPWVEALGKESVRVRRYEHRQGDITDDFLAAVGLDVALPEGSERWENPRFPDVLIETHRLWNQLDPSPGLMARFKEAAFAYLDAGSCGDDTVDLLSPGARKQLYDAFVDVDARLTELLGLESSLFPDLDEIAAPTEGALLDTQAHARHGRQVMELAFGERSSEFDEDAPPPSIGDDTRALGRRVLGAVRGRLGR